MSFSLAMFSSPYAPCFVVVVGSCAIVNLRALARQIESVDIGYRVMSDSILVIDRLSIEPYSILVIDRRNAPSGCAPSGRWAD
jgi:hypothetical protein